MSPHTTVRLFIYAVESDTSVHGVLVRGIDFFFNRWISLAIILFLNYEIFYFLHQNFELKCNWLQLT